MLGLIWGVVLALFLWIGPANAARPNFVFVITDDMSLAMLDHMPLTRAAIGGEGTEFRQAFVSTPICCPSRATALTGQYATNHRVLTNLRGGQYGMEMFDDSETLPVWLQRAGYRTGLIGKYMNGYVERYPVSYVPPGWAYWFAGRQHFHDQAEVHYSMNGEEFVLAPGKYGADVETEQALRFIRSSGGQPFYLYLSYAAPHLPRAAPPRHAALFQTLKAPRTPAYCEADIGDKESVFTTVAIDCNQDQRAGLDTRYRQAIRSLQAVDEGVAAIVEEIERTGLARNTFVIFTSDHGNHFGEHRLYDAKDTPFEVDISVPFLVRGPGIPHRVDNSTLVLNSDTPATILGFAGIPVPAMVDGRNSYGIWKGSPGDLPRRAFPIFRYKGENFQSKWYQDAIGVRTHRWKWVRWAGGGTELYDLDSDPYELVDLTSLPPLEQARYAGTMAHLDALAAAFATCRGIACRSLEKLPAP